MEEVIHNPSFQPSPSSLPMAGEEQMERRQSWLLEREAKTRPEGVPGYSFEEWVALVRRRAGKYSASTTPVLSPKHEAMPLELHPSSASPCHHPNSVVGTGSNSGELDNYPGKMQSCNQAPEISLWERLGNAAMLDIESNCLPWDALSSLHHIKNSSSPEHSEDEMNKALEVTVNSGGVVFYALFNNPDSDDLLPKEAAAVIKFSTSRMATQSERLGYEFAKLLGVRTPQARVVHNSCSEWQRIKDAAERARDIAISVGHEVGEITCSELLEALELSRCLFLMNYVHGSPLLENSDAFGSREAAGKSAAALGRVLVLDLIVRNEDRLPCRQLGWRGNSANLLVADKSAFANMNALEDAYNTSARTYKPHIAKSIQIERRAISVNGRLCPHKSEPMLHCSDEINKASHISTEEEESDEKTNGNFCIIAIDSGVPRRPPIGKRARDQEQYPKVVELMLNNWQFSSNLLHELSGGKLGFASPEEVVATLDSGSSLSDADMAAIVNEFRVGFRGGLRDLQGFHIFLLTLHQKLDGLLRVFSTIISKSSSELDRDEYGTLESPSHPSGLPSNSVSVSGREISLEPHAYSSDSEPQRCVARTLSSRRESLDVNSPICRENWNGKYMKGSSLRLTMKLRDFNKYAKVDAELSKELEQWNEMLRTDVVKFCQENNFNTGFFEGSDNNIVIDAYELKVRLEHILERISLISDAASTERPSPITSNLFIGGALAARSVYTLQRLGITHILCLCTNEIGQSDSQHPEFFEYRNFSISDDDDEDIGDLFQEACDFIDYVEYLEGKVLVHCFEGKSRSATIVLAYLMLRKGCTLLEAWNMLKKVHRRAQPNDGFAQVLLDLDTTLHGRPSMEWQHRRPLMKVCPICGKNAGLSSSSLKLHLQKSHRKISSGSVDSAMTLEIHKALEALKISRGGSVSPNQKQSHQSFIDGFH